jgi:hypothetical protein
MGQKISKEFFEVGGTGSGRKITTHCQYCGIKKFNDHTVEALKNSETTIKMIKDDFELNCLYESSINPLSCKNIRCLSKMFMQNRNGWVMCDIKNMAIILNCDDDTSIGFICKNAPYH